MKEKITVKEFSEVIENKWKEFREYLLSGLHKNIKYSIEKDSRTVEIEIPKDKVKFGIFLQKINETDFSNNAEISENQDLKIDCASSSKPLILAALERLYRTKLNLGISELEIPITDEIRNDMNGEDAMKRVLADHSLNSNTIQTISGNLLIEGILKYSSNSGLLILMNHLYGMLKTRNIISSVGEIPPTNNTNLIRDFIDDEVATMCGDLGIPNTYTTRYSTKSLRNVSPNTCNLDTLTILNTSIWNGDNNLGLRASFVKLIKRYSSETLHLDRGNNEPEFYNKLKKMFPNSGVSGIVEKQGFYPEFIDWNVDNERRGVKSWHAIDEFPDIMCDSDQTRGCMHMSTTAIVEIEGQRYRFGYAIAIPVIINKELDPYTELDQKELDAILQEFYLELQGKIWK